MSLVKNISSGNLETIASILETIDYDYFDDLSCIVITNDLLARCLHFQGDDASIFAAIILPKFLNKTNPPIDNYLLCSKNTTEQVKKLIIDSLKKNLIDYMLDLFNCHEENISNLTEEMFPCFVNLFEDATEIEWRKVYAVMKDEFDTENCENIVLDINITLIRLIEEHATAKKFDISKPQWMNLERFDELEDDYPNIPQVYQVLEYFKEDRDKWIKVSGIHLQDLEDNFCSLYSLSLYEQKAKILKDFNVIVPNYDEKRLFKAYGPLNMIKSSFDLDKTTICGKYGGCRMLLCNEFNCNEEENDFNWFTGSCDACQKEIKNYRHSLRIPLKDGGWKDNYCSFKCLPVDKDLKEILREQLGTFGIDE
jgi:hypothetical protein